MLNRPTPHSDMAECGTASVVSRVCIPDSATIAEARRLLAACDPALARVDALTPGFRWWARPAGYPALVWMIIGQQVSVASAEAVWARLEAECGSVTPQAVLALGEEGLRSIGFSRQKSRYVRLIADAPLDYEAVRRASDDDALKMLTALTGVGPWTAECYLMMSEGRLDIFPAGDIALQEAIRWADGLETRPGAAATHARSETWRPWRSVAAHLLWTWYVGVKGGVLHR